jgi:pimeloyl-ACP methyl ester carboxylesterase
MPPGAFGARQDRAARREGKDRAVLAAAVPPRDIRANPQPSGMPVLTRPCGAKIAYEVKGTGYPVLLLAPGGMSSCLANWAKQPYDPWTQLSTSKFKLIAMDQRNGGQSTGPLHGADGWSTFTKDQFALLDHLGVQRCHTVGSCIGPAYQLRLMSEQPDRFAAAVMMQPIGLARHTTEPGPRWEGINSDASEHWFGWWAKEMAVRR